VQFIRTVVLETASSPELREGYWGTVYVRGYLCVSVGAVDEQTAKPYIESEHWDEDDQGFKITAPTEPGAVSEPGTLQAA
jgi:hypothetical protein